MTCMMEIWERVRSEVTKFMNGNKKLLKKSQKVQLKLMQLSPEIRDQFFRQYLAYCKKFYLIRFLNWRLQKLKLQG